MSSVDNEIIKKAQLAIDFTEIRNHIDQISAIIAQTEKPVELLRLRASLWVKLDEKGRAINDFREILKYLPQDVEAEGQVHLLQTILRYNNSDIYANTNTHMDPWLE